MTATLVYLVGAPGVGKSTFMATLTAGCVRTLNTRPFAHDRLTSTATGDPVGVELGRRREKFSGTDALSLSVSPAACRWIAARPAPLVLAEGDRLATTGFLTAAAADGGYDVHLVWLDAPDNILDQRCAQRGSAQNETWRRGRATKVRNLTEAAGNGGWKLHRIDASTQPPRTLVAQLRNFIQALHALPEA